LTAKITEDPTYRERTFVFQGRQHAGKLLAQKLRKYTIKGKVILLALPSGGVPVGIEIAKELKIPMDVMIVRKVQIPWNTEAGFGAVTMEDETVLNEPLVAQLGLTREVVEESILKTKRIIQERLRKFRGNKPMPDLKGKIVILVDDGLASGFTMLAAARSAKKRAPEKIIAAIPTGSLGAIELVSSEVDEIVCLNIRTGPVFAVADAYRNWYDLTDEEVIRSLKALEKHI
jgi:putative phosphoribosyl transferase